MTTPGCRKAFVGFLAAFAPRRQNQRGCPTCSSPCLPSNPCPQVLPPGVSLPVVFHRFLLSPQMCQNTSCVAGRRQGCEAFRMISADCFYLRSSGFLPTGLEEEQNAAIHCPNTRCSWQMGCALRTCLRKTGEVRQVGERLTIGQAGRFCASQAPQLCLAAARMILRLAPSRRSTRTSVRLDGCFMFS